VRAWRSTRSVPFRSVTAGLGRRSPPAPACWAAATAAPLAPAAGGELAAAAKTAAAEAAAGGVADGDEAALAGVATSCELDENGELVAAE
jgi:hypothetical protein